MIALMAAGIGLSFSEPVLAKMNPAFVPTRIVQSAYSSPANEGWRITGADLEVCHRRQVCGTDLGIPFTLPDGNTALAFGDTFPVADPAHQVGLYGWRSPVLLRSDDVPTPDKPITFDSAVGIKGDGMAPEIIPNGHNDGNEYTVIPTDGVSFPETGNVIVSYMSIRSWDRVGDEEWQTNYAGLAWSPDGEHFYRIGPTWENDSAGDNPFQMWSMQRDGDFVYIVSTRAGRQYGPMMLMRVPWDRMLEKAAYECFDGYGWGGECAPMSYGVGKDRQLMEGRFGEPSLRKIHFDDAECDTPQKRQLSLGNCDLWVLSYLDREKLQIVTHFSSFPGGPAGPWSEPKVQVTWDQFPFLYGGYIHPLSTPSNMTLMVSTWRPPINGDRARYDVTQFHGNI